MQYVLCTSLEKSRQTNPIIGRIESKAGHGAGRPTQKMVKIFDFLSFLLVTNVCLFDKINPKRLFLRLMKLQTDMDSCQRCWMPPGLIEPK